MKDIFPGADENTPSRSEYFSWINNTNEGATEEHTMINLAFFEWLFKEYGMVLDIYAFDAGALDGPRQLYGRLGSDKFKRQFPRGFEPIAEKARSIDCRLGIWGGPDGFGETEEDAQARIDLMSGLCKPPLNFALFKFDGVCGTLRPEKAKYFVKMMQEARKHSPDLILLNHRLKLYEGLPYATTFLLGGKETYIDIHLCNKTTCVHHRQEALARELPKLPDGRLTRMTEDHGVCISTFPDAWDDDLVLQAFNRGLILAPEIYGNPWFLRDDEFPKLARIFNLFRRYRDILVHGFELPQEYGLNPISRGDGKRRFLALRNMMWETITIPVKLDSTIGLDKDVKKVVVRCAHPRERWHGEFNAGETFSAEIPPFHSYLLMVFEENGNPFPEITIKGCDFDVLKEKDDAPVEINLFGLPGTSVNVELLEGARTFNKATIDGEVIPANIQGLDMKIQFPGEQLKEEWHRKLATLKKIDIPSDIAVLYETVAYAADNSCLEVRCIRRSGETSIPEVQRCRDAFFSQPILHAKGCWDRYAFDGNDTTIWNMGWDEYNCLRVDFGKVQKFDRVRLVASGQVMDKPIVARTSADLKRWHKLTSPGTSDSPKAVEIPDCPDMREKHPRNLDVRFKGESRVPNPPNQPNLVEFGMPNEPIRYFQMEGTPDDVFEVNAMVDGKWLTAEQRTAWHGTFMFENTKDMEFQGAWIATITLNEIPNDAKLCIACEGDHGAEGIYATLRVNGELVGAPERAPAYMGRQWEAGIRNSNSNYTYYFPLRQEWVNQPIEIVCIGTDYYEGDCKPEAWITVWSDAYTKRKLILE
ncbi:MAG: discoidin domain-containing protein [Candidatus Hodarchaeota archaeon]